MLATLSPVDDVFKLDIAKESELPIEYKECFLYRWQMAVTELSEKHLRDEVLLPLDPKSTNRTQVWSNVHEGIVLPTWHCGFRGCVDTSSSHETLTAQNHEKGVWQHIWAVHGHVLRNLITQYKLKEETHKLIEKYANY